MRDLLVTERCQHTVDVEFPLMRIVIWERRLVMMGDGVDMSTRLQEINMTIYFLILIFFKTYFAHFVSIAMYLEL